MALRWPCPPARGARPAPVAAACDRCAAYPRRQTIASVAAVVVGAPRAGSSKPQTLQAAIDAAAPGATLYLEGVPGRGYKERVTINKPVSLVSDSASPASLEWETSRPYESAVLVLPGGRLRLEGIKIRHSSPSVANNYAVFVQGGALEAVGCDISSSTGSGIGLEGGALVAVNTSIHDCVGNGAVLAGAIEDPGDDDPSQSGPEVRLEMCNVTGNGGSGIVALDNATLAVVDSTVAKNRKLGLDLRDCTLSLEATKVTQNSKGSILLRPGAVLQTESSSRTSVIQPGAQQSKF